MSQAENQRELIAQLCDGDIGQTDLAQLNQWLQSDPLLQQECLDQLLIEGLLRYEYGMDRPSVPDTLAAVPLSNTWWLAPGKLVSVGLLSLLVGVWWAQSKSNKERQLEFAIPLSNVSFENPSLISHRPTSNGWYGDIARIVRADDENAAPDGQHMLQLIRSIHQPADGCEVYQAFELSHIHQRNSEDDAFIEATVAVNARGTDSNEVYILSLELFTSSVNPVEQQRLEPSTWNRDLMTAGKQVFADSDRDSWQEIKLIMPLNKDARFGLVKISVRHDDADEKNEFTEIYVDDLQVRVRNIDLL